MTHTLNIQHLPPEAIHSLMLHLPDYVKVALMEKATQLECSLEAAIEMAIASFLDSEAFNFEDCLLSQRLKESELVEFPQSK
ncbi:MAG: hypothetical protein ACM65M_17880 [Microcoleus sp.]